MQNDHTKSCTFCGKYVSTSGGSMTSWIFGRSRCLCQKRPGEKVVKRFKDLHASEDSELFSEERANIEEERDLSNIDLGEDYKILQYLGEGGMSTVFEVAKKGETNTFALKLLKEELATDKGAVKRFQREGQAVSKLNHVNLVSYYEIGETPDGIPFFVMDYVNGQSIKDLIEKDGIFEPEKIVEVMLPVTEAIEYAHKNGVVHRDIKPSNILQSYKGVIKVVDFGIAKIVGELLDSSMDISGELTQSGEVFGSPHYMSPEQCMGDSADQRSDIYSLGCVLYELLSGHPPHEGANPIKIIFGHLNEKPAKIKSDKRMQKGLQDIAMRCLEKKARNRYQNVSEVVKDLRLVQNGKAPKFAYQSPARKRKILRASIMVASFVVVALGGFNLYSATISGDKSDSKESAEKSNEIAKQNQLLIDRFSKEILAHPNDSYWYMMRGTAYRESGQHMDALMDFTMVINKDPKDAKAYRARAWTRNLMKEWNKGLEDYTTAIKLDPNFSDAYIGRANDYLALGKFQMAYNDCSKACKLNPHDPMAFHNRAVASFRLGNIEESFSDSNKAIKLDPSRDLFRITRSRTAEKLERYQLGISDLSSIIKKNPNDIPRTLERGHLYVISGDFEKALKDAKRIAQIDPENAICRVLWARALFGLGKYSEALRQIEIGISKRSDIAELYKVRGDIFVAQNHKDKARENYNKALKCWPGYEEAKEALKKTDS